MVKNVLHRFLKLDQYTTWLLVWVFYNMASDWLAAVLPANQKLGLKSQLTDNDFNTEFSF